MTIESMPEVLTVREAAEVFRVEIKTIYRLIWTGSLRVVRLGRAIRIPKAELIRLFDSEGV